MPRIAGDKSTYDFKLVDWAGNVTAHGFSLPSVTTILGKVLGKPASAMAWWGYRIGIEGVADVFGDETVPSDPVEVEKAIREAKYSPNDTLSKAGDRGRTAHDVLELLAQGERAEAERLAVNESEEFNTKYSEGVIRWFDDFTKDWEDQTFPSPNMIAERPVWSLTYGYAGMFDLGIYSEGAWEVLDLKTHKPARGFTKPGKGPAYLSDLLQVRAYRTALTEDAELDYPETRGNRIIIARENGTYLEDRREVPEELWLAVLDVYQQIGYAGLEED